MPSKQSIHSFNGGMILDNDKSIVSPNTYDESYNFRYLADNLGDTGKLYVPNASSILVDDFQSDERIMGHCVIGGYLILFTFDYASSPSYYQRIHRYKIVNNVLTDHVLLWYGSGNGSDTAAFSISEPLSCVGRHESEDLIKVYWASSDFPTRMANISKYLTSDSLIKSGSNTYLSNERFNLITSFSNTPSLGVSIEVDSIVSGSLQSGKVQYAFNLIKNNFQESTISSTTSLIPLYESNISINPTSEIEGDAVTTNTGKGVKLNIKVSSNDVTYYDKLRLYRIYYSEYGSTPTITVVGDYKISSTLVNVVDSGGVGLGSYSSEEFSVLSNILYNAYTINEKDGVLIGSNVTENTFDVDFDARAYRFKSTGSTYNPRKALLYDDYDETTLEYTINYTGNVTDGTGGGVTNWSDIPVTATLANPFNSVQYDDDTSRQYMYQTDGSTLGGEGPNIKYTFSNGYTDLILDNDISNAVKWDSQGSSEYSGSSNYGNSLVAHDVVGYQRDEIYRFGIVFIDENGQESPVKWIGDIKFPSSLTTSGNYGIVGTLGSYSYMYPLGIKIIMKSALPTGAVGWKLVRAKRTENDKTVLRAGALISTQDYSSSTHRKETPSFAYDAGGLENIRLHTFITPENIYNSSTVIKPGDKVDIQAYYSSTYRSSYADGARERVAYKYYGLVLLPNYSSWNVRYTISNNLFIKPSYSQNILNTYTITGARTNTYVGWVEHDGSTAKDNPQGRGDILDLGEDVDTTIGSGADNMGYGYIKRDNPSRYGGLNYLGRVNTDYIPCGQPVDDVSSGGTVFYGGDTYINFFEYVYGMKPLDVSATTNARLRVIIFPVESTINLDLSSGNLISRNSEIFTSSDFGIDLLKEEAGVYGYNDTSETYIQEKDLYLYNTIYSQEQNIDYNTSIDEDITLNTYHPNRIIYSDSKIDNSTVDAWTVFRPNNYIDVTGTYGPIYKLEKWNNEIFFIQEDAFGHLPINQRSLINDNNIGTLSLGTGEILNRYDYVSTFNGIQFKSSSDCVKSGIYFIDKKRKCLMRYNGKLEDLGIIKGLRSYFHNNTPVYYPLVSGSNTEGEVYISYKDGETVVFNYLTDNFTPFYTYTPRYIGDSKLFTLYQISGDSNVYGLYLNDNLYGSFQDGVYSDSKLKFIDNSEFGTTKVYDNLKFFTNYTKDNVDQAVITFDKVKYNNDYQTTGEVSLSIPNKGGLSNTNLRRREREFSTYIPRNIVEENERDNLDINDSLNQDTTRSFKERMRDKYLEVTLTFTNTLTKAQGRLSIPYTKLIYRNSNR